MSIKYTREQYEKASVAHSWLVRAKQAEEEIKEQLEQIEMLKAQAVSVGSAVGGVRARSTGDKVGMSAALILDEVRQLDEMIAAKQHTRERIRIAIEAVPDHKYRLLLTQRYLLYKTWEQAADAAGYDKDWYARNRVAALCAVRLPWITETDEDAEEKNK